MCWCRIADGGNESTGTKEELELVQVGIRKTVKMLTATLERENLDVPGEYGRIVDESDKRLTDLLLV